MLDLRSTFGLAALAALAPSALGGTCDGKQGWHLDAPSTVAIGAAVDLGLTGPADEMAFLMVSLGASFFILKTALDNTFPHWFTTAERVMAFVT